MQNENLSPIRAFLRNKWVLAFFAVDAIAIIILVGIIIHQSSRTSTIQFNIAPIDATISINGDTSFKNGRYSIAPGKYDIIVSHDGLESKKLSIDINTQDYATVTTFLADSDKKFNFYEYKDNYLSYQKLKSIASADNNTTSDEDTSAQEFIVNYEKRLSLLNELPIKGFVYATSGNGASTGGYSIQNGRNSKKCDKTACLLISYYGKDYENAVVQRILDAGYNPADYQVVYERYADANK